MALVKVIANNLFAGANFQKLEVGGQVEVSDDVANRWVSAGLAERIGNVSFEVATPSKRGRKKRGENGEDSD
ncbi:hypothetical protein AU509_12105 [Lonsdalea britannica]|uniref:Uncharacterized protein n=1 Tax=Lonsdalea britannica TaxID=1082704 RepID=A0AAD0SME7_9GAMM|nr:hypothetical protein [Lonsdalea britannica]AXW87818.1 hypothetical protein CKQ53_13125 [Lonsdalea britannica]OSM95942.1 hypothetical protein AU509_12105 [Lonsdalea britannica]